MDLVLVVQLVLTSAIAGCCIVLIFVGPERRAEAEREEARRR